jgi:hypothetical protein
VVATSHAVPVDGARTDPSRSVTQIDPPMPPRPEPDTSEDARWASWARLFHSRNLSAGAESSLDFDDRLRSESVNDPTTAPLLERGWPFEEHAPRPRLISNLAAPDEMAIAEWRRRGNRLAASFSMGNTDVLRECHQMMESLQRSIDGRSAQPDWVRDASIATRCPDSTGSLAPNDEAFSERGTEREAWASAWADAYPIGKSALRLIIATDAQRGCSMVGVFGLGDDGKGSVLSQQIGGIFGSGGCTAGPCVVHADFDANGTPDFFIATWGVSNGICIKGHGGVFVLSDAKRRTARITPFDGENMEFIDHDGNGRAEILVRSLKYESKCLDGRPHNFWVTQLLGFQDLGVVDLREVDVIRHLDFVGRFPLIEWFSHDPKHRFRKLLSEEQRAEMGRSGFPLYRRR